MSKSKIKTVLFIFFDVKAVFVAEYIQLSQTMNQKYYIQLMLDLHERRWRKRLKWENGWILHQDSTLVHSVLSDRQFMAKKKK
jgi:hypothetical protein